MNLTTQKRLAASILKVGLNRVWMDPERMEEISKEAGYSSITFYHDYDFNPPMEKSRRFLCLLKK